MMPLERPLAFRFPLLRGADVRRAQLALLRAGEAPGEPDGVFGPLTAEALRRFQRRHGLPADGVLGPAAWAALADHPALRVARPWAEVLRPFLPALTVWHAGPVGGGRRWRLIRGGVVVEGEAGPRRRASALPADEAARAAAARAAGVPVELLIAAALTRPDLAPDVAAETLARQARAEPATGFDPPLAGAALALGALRPDAAAPWGVAEPPGAASADAFAAALGDAHARFAAGAPPSPDTPSFWELLA
jgi:hypothetical protein